MSLDDASPQKFRQLELPLGERGETSGTGRSVEASTAATGNARPGASELMALVCERQNLKLALKRVRDNKGSPGIDGMTVDQLPDHLRVHWIAIREDLLAGRYQPQLVQEGRGWVVDIDLEKFFDRVNHDVLMSRLARRVGDRCLLGLVRRYLDAGNLVHGVAIERHEGTPQGGPLSPFLANVLLDDVDKELEKRGSAFVRYADDLNVHVRSKRAGERVMASMRRLYARLRLQVNESKSAVAQTSERKFLGFSFWATPEGEARLPRGARAGGQTRRR